MLQSLSKSMQSVGLQTTHAIWHGNVGILFPPQIPWQSISATQLPSQSVKPLSHSSPRSPKQSPPQISHISTISSLPQIPSQP